MPTPANGLLIRTIPIPASIVGMEEGTLTLTHCDRPFPLEDRDYCTMSLSTDEPHYVIAESGPFGTGMGGSWDDKTDAEIAATFAAFLTAALEEGDGEGWTILEADADLWADACTMAGLTDDDEGDN